MAMRDIPYSSELEAQEDFYRYMAEVGLFPQEEVDFSGHTDGVFGNILLENKLEIRGNYFKALRQMIKYQAKRMWRGKTLPRYMIANGLNDRWSYVFLTEDFISEIEEIPVSAESASKGNSSYHTDIQPIAQFNWYTLDGLSELKKYKEDPTLGPRYHVSVNNIIGLSKQAYKNGLTKTQFLDEEIRHPNLLADRILPYEESTNDAFKKVMDVLNTPVMQRELGAFYTPVVYVQKAQEFLMKAIDEIKAMYVPCWLYDANISASASFNCEKVRHYSDNDYDYKEIEYYNVFRRANMDFENVPVDGSTKIDSKLIESIEPFDIKDAQSFNTSYLAGYMAEKYNIDEYESANRANQRIENSAMGQLESSILGYSNVTLASSQISLLNGRVKYALLPVWFLITTYHNQQYIFAMNGQTGKFVGDLPVDKSLLVKKFLLLFVLLLVVISALLLLI